MKKRILIYTPDLLVHINSSSPKQAIDRIMDFLNKAKTHGATHLEFVVDVDEDGLQQSVKLFPHYTREETTEEYALRQAREDFKKLDWSKIPEDKISQIFKIIHQP